MKSIETRIIILVIITILVIATGILLNKKEKPYNIAITTVHKLLSIASIILCITIAYYQ